jgi:pimeloyl-ACP methyl ester carboxylesterase
VIFYLHGFASSSKSTKGSYFADRLRQHDVVLECPDFNAPDFSTMTMTRMLEQLGAALGRAKEPAALIGSSLGGTLAILAAARFAVRVDKLVLLAPAVMFAKPGHHLLPPERIEEWRRRGALPFFHYGYGEERLLNVSFYEDSLAHDAFDASFSQPTLVFQGLRDASVDYRTVEAFANARPNVTLALLDDDHQLIDSLPRMWQDIEAFLGLHE